MEINKIYQGNVLDVLKTFPSECINTTVTSPPYFHLRSYLPNDHPDKSKEIGLEKSAEEYIQNLTDISKEIFRVTHKTGTFWCNIADRYTPQSSHKGGTQYDVFKNTENWSERSDATDSAKSEGKHKDLMLIPYRVAERIQATGWFLRNSIIWYKTNPPPHPVTDRCVSSHEHIFLFSKSKNYFFDHISIREPATTVTKNQKIKFGGNKYPDSVENATYSGRVYEPNGYRNKRDVWIMNPSRIKEKHYATFPLELPTTCIKAGTSEYGRCVECKTPWVRNRSARATYIEGWHKNCNCSTNAVEPCVVLDPFIGVGSSAIAAINLNRNFVGIDLNGKYVNLANEKIKPLMKIKREQMVLQT